VYDVAVNLPTDGVRVPLNLVVMERGSRVEFEIDEYRGASIPILHAGAVWSRVVINIDEHLARIPAQELNTYLLTRAVPVQEHAGD
jgi:hypothetical protein